MPVKSQGISVGSNEICYCIKNRLFKGTKSVQILPTGYKRPTMVCMLTCPCKVYPGKIHFKRGKRDIF